MLADDARIVSVNDHVIEPADLFRDRLAASLAGRAPTVVDVGGTPSWAIGSERFAIASTSLQEGSPAAGDAARVRRMWEAAGQPAARLAAMAYDGVEAHTIFPHGIGFAGEHLRHLADPTLWAACARAYNDYVLLEYCGADPARLLGIAVLPLADVTAAAAEVRRVAALGARGVSFPHDPTLLGLPSLHDGGWAPLFAAIDDAGLPVFVHLGTAPPRPRPGAPYEVTLTLGTTDVLTTLVDLAFSPLLGHHPALRVVLLEAGIGWIPWLTERIDYFWARQGGSAGGRRPPSERLRDQVFAAFVDDPAGLAVLAAVGVERVLWMSDFPHPDCGWPDSRARLGAALAAVAAPDAAAIAGGNARRLLRLPEAS